MLRTLDAHHAIGTRALFGLAVLTFVALFFVAAPYGRHLRRGWGPTLGAPLAWVIMESPAVVLFLVVFFAGRHAAEPVPLVLLAFWLAHYAHRTFVFPTRLPPTSKRMPLSVVALGFAFQLLNVSLNARAVSELGRYDLAWLGDPRFLAGAVLFATGLIINVRADYALLRLKRRDGRYVVPHGGLFEHVVSPNYFGELVEWCGWALMAWSLPALAFAAYTFANLAPRALAHRRWYRERFPDFPRSRRAIIPFVL
jgi:3-oxo-5-alpha-steroid 4-dehydrogenase 1